MVPLTRLQTLVSLMVLDVGSRKIRCTSASSLSEKELPNPTIPIKRFKLSGLIQTAMLIGVSKFRSFSLA
jgi:hypothetical protein